MPTPTIYDRIREQRAWIRSCGQTLSGYCEHYGRASDPNHYGDGGEAIYKADIDALHALEKEAGVR